jgi:hypothetical protein
MRTRSDPVEKPAADQDTAADARERFQDASRPPARADHADSRHQAAAATEFERLKSRLRQLVGSNGTKR